MSFSKPPGFQFLESPIGVLSVLSRNCWTGCALLFIMSGPLLSGPHFRIGQRGQFQFATSRDGLSTLAGR